MLRKTPMFFSLISALVVHPVAKYVNINLHSNNFSHPEMPEKRHILFSDISSDLKIVHQRKINYLKTQSKSVITTFYRIFIRRHINKHKLLLTAEWRIVGGGTVCWVA